MISSFSKRVTLIKLFVMEAEERKPGYWVSALNNRCPRCRRGRMFQSRNAYDLRNTLKMFDHCEVCGQPMEIEVGFYYGTSYVSYALTVAFSVTTFILWWLLIGISVKAGDNRLFYWLIFNAVLMIGLQPVFMRLSRSLWLSWFVKYERNWKNDKIDPTNYERIVPEQMNNW